MEKKLIELVKKILEIESIRDILNIIEGVENK